MTALAPTHIAMWSGPRNISTALMYAFASRADCMAFDEPFYGAYLKATGLKHPMAEEIVNTMECDAHTVAKACIKPSAKPITYQKHMTHHMLQVFDRKFICELSSAFLIRSPEKVLASYAKKHDEVSLHAIGYVEQAEIFDLVAQHLGHPPPVVDGDIHLANPRKSLQQLCTNLKIGYDEVMLAWPKGPKACDGVWAPHWYNAAWQSTGFSAPTQAPATLPDHLRRVADQAQPYYEKLKAHAFAA